MMDISMGKDEKAYYITNVKMKDDGENFIVFYADGHTEEHEFTIHNYNVYIYRMKHQILDNRWSYKSVQQFVISLSVAKELKTLMLSITGLVLASGLPIPNLIKIIMIILVTLYNIGYSFKQLIAIVQAYIKLGMFNSLDEFVNIMEELRIDVKDPITGWDEDWYLINIGDIRPDTNIEAIKQKAKLLTTDDKKNESQKINQMIKEKFAKRLVKAPKQA